MTTEYESVAVLFEAQEPHTPWSEEQARRIAEREGLGELTEAHWRMIHNLREHFIQYGAVPPMALACSMSRLEARCAEKLFSSANGLWRVAGLPEPGSELLVGQG